MRIPNRWTVVALLAIMHCINAFAEDYVGQIVSVNGKVLVRTEASQQMQMTFLKAGDKIYKGSIVNTSSSGAVKILMTDRTIIDLGPSALFKVNDYQLNKGGDRKVDIGVDYGQVRASVNQPISSDKGKFTIRTKSATMGVRGTEFVINSVLADRKDPSAGSAKTELTVIKGRVEVADANHPTIAPTMVKAGMQLVQGTDIKPTVSQLDTQKIQAIRAESFQKDMTFVQAVVVEPNKEPAGGGSSSSDKAAGDKGSADKGGDKAADKGGGGDKAAGDAKAGGAGGAGGNQTLASIATTVGVQTQSQPAPSITDIKVPGTFQPNQPPPRPVDVLNGRNVNLNVKVNL